MEVKSKTSIGLEIKSIIQPFYELLNFISRLQILGMFLAHLFAWAFLIF